MHTWWRIKIVREEEEERQGKMKGLCSLGEVLFAWEKNR